ncbi:SNF2-related protein [Aromatoleum aromaticum]|uniref:Helicase (Snf2 family) n=1 Tax=Aromatoleum aromaticum (strain DSM 19018 / LMG 30748 / EbN1) TaxID=76114 RepID=Q5P890_AROAE|nr:SNF2-related protein [Aromatoleum aromaticum]NMG55268.1 ATP-dependent helicase [Aromatoleum aromaticum]CAI06469.1 helicase (Snf2 family) [Aromatoleum aromaticum EbN1]
MFNAECLTPHHAKYYAWELTRRHAASEEGRLSQSLFDASVDLNPHQIDAALFALENPLSKGVMLADEVGLGKTIEAALVMCQLWAERRRRLLVICPAALRKQWAQELSDKFNVPAQVLDARTWLRLRQEGIYEPLDRDVISIMSLNFAARMEAQLGSVPWDLVVIDEAHKLRNAHRKSHETGQSLKRSLAGRRKLLLTATPLQNSLLELYGLSSLIDEDIFGDERSFRAQYGNSGGDLIALRRRLQPFVKRTLRKDVLEYVPYTRRHALTTPFTPSDDEQRLYDLISAYLQCDFSYGFPQRQKHLVALILRKLLASSTEAVVTTLEAIRDRLQKLFERQSIGADWFEHLVEGDELDEELLEAAAEDAEAAAAAGENPAGIDFDLLRSEMVELDTYISIAHGIREDQKSHALLNALEQGFARLADMGAPRKAVIFTESRRTQEYLARFLEAHGHAGKVVTFSGGNQGTGATGIYQRWLARYAGSDRATGSPAVDRRTALIDYFREHAEILIATEAAAEGVNLQFCSLVVNYDLPWNPQRVEQRIGRCHRYGQRFDVVVINFLNQRNEADRRVLELLQDKFRLFDGVFGASDEILGRIEAGIDFEKRIAEIYDRCRTPQEIDAAFADLRAELDADIQARMQETEKLLLEHFDADIHNLLKTHRERAETQIDRISRLFWLLTRHVLAGKARFDARQLAFDLALPPLPHIPAGHYQLIRKGESARQAPPEHTRIYRLTHPLGEYVLDQGRNAAAADATLQFDYARWLEARNPRISVIERLVGQNGWLQLNLLELDSFQREEHLVFTAQADSGELLDQETCEKLFQLMASVQPAAGAAPEALHGNARRQLDAALSRALEQNDKYFQQEREKLDAWADDRILAAEQALQDTKLRLKGLKRQARLAQSMDEARRMQDEIRRAEGEQRRQRQEIFAVEDEIETRRDALIEALEKRLHRASRTHTLFTVRWTVR